LYKLHHDPYSAYYTNNIIFNIFGVYSLYLGTYLNTSIKSIINLAALYYLYNNYFSRIMFVVDKPYIGGWGEGGSKKPN